MIQSRPATSGPDPGKPARYGLLALAAAVLLAAPGQALQRGEAARPQRDESVLTVNGTGEYRVDPDEAQVRLGITRQSPTAGTAQEAASAAAQNILEAVKRLGVDEKQIQTSRLTLFPVYAGRRPGGAEEEPRIVAYRASNVVSVRLDKLALVGPVIDAATRAGANQVEGIQFSLRNDLPARERALRAAVDEAQQKARAIAAALRLNLGRVVEVQESGVSVIPLGVGGGAIGRMEAAATPVSPGQVTVNAAVSIRYALEPERRPAR